MTNNTTPMNIKQQQFAMCAFAAALDDDESDEVKHVWELIGQLGAALEPLIGERVTYRLLSSFSQQIESYLYNDEETP
jgi:hypothetical protein